MFYLKIYKCLRKMSVILSFGIFLATVLTITPEISAQFFAPQLRAGRGFDRSESTKSLFSLKHLTKKQDQIFVGAANGEAFRLVESGGKVETLRLKTSKSVFRAFGLSANGRKLLYTALENGVPTGALYLEDLTTGKRRKITSRLVISAAFSPTDDNRIAYSFAGGETFGLEVAKLGSGKKAELIDENVFAEIFQWNADGSGIYYFENDDDGKNMRLVARFASVGSAQTNGSNAAMSWHDEPDGFPILETSKETKSFDYQILPESEITETKQKFRISAPDGAHEVSGENLLDVGEIFFRHGLSNEFKPLGVGQIVKTLPNGAVIKRFSATETKLQFVDWAGQATTLATTVVSYNLPLQNASLVQGGAGYASPGSCNLTSHSGTMDFAYDLQSSTVGAHVLAAADGLVVFNTSTVVCNTIDTTSCPDYNAGGCSGTYLGNVVIVQHADGTYTKYAHLQTNSPQVEVGTNVCQGLYVGRQGHTGSTNGTFNGCGDHLHFQRQTSPDIFGQSIAVDFADAANPLSCGLNYNSASTEKAHTISSNSQNFGVAGGSGSVNVTSTGCSWTAVSSNNWITIQSPNGGSGNGTISYTVADNSAGGARTGSMNVGGHLFTVTQIGGGVSNQSPTVNAGVDQTITLPANAALSGTANDDGLPNPPAALTTVWSKVSGAGTVSFANANALNTTASFSSAGIYVLRLSADDGSLSASDDLTVTVNVNNGGGTIAVTQGTVPSNVNLKNEGAADWAHWGLSSATSSNYKNGVVRQIGNFTQIGTISPLRYTNNPNSYTWTGGTPTASANNTTTGVYLYGIGNGFQLSVPADATSRTLKLYVGLWAAEGKLEATLSDGSASAFVDTSLTNANGVSNRVYSLNYRAASAGQTLTVKWTVNANFHPAGNVTLQAATLNVNAAPTNQPPTVNAGVDRTIYLPANANLSGAANDDGLPNPPAMLTTVWSKVSGAGTVSFANSNALNTTASFSSAGVYVLRLSATDGTLSSFDDVAITVNNQPSGGLIAVSSSNTPSNVDLTTIGTNDWAHWGLSSANSFNHKNIAASSLNYTILGNGAVQRYTNNPSVYSWTDGSPTAAVTNTATGVYVMGQDKGFQITAPADTTTRTLKLYVGLWSAGGKLEAALSDGSAANLIDTSLINSSDTSSAVYTIDYRAASSGQNLIVKWTTDTVFNNWSNVTLQAAALTGNAPPPTNQPPTVNAGNNQTISLPSNAALNGTANDDGLPNPPAALTTVWSKISGAGTVSFANSNALNTTANFSSAGTYVLRLSASDSVLSAYSDVTVTVNNQPSGGFLTVSNANTPSNVNLTTIGTLDWIHWGLSSPASFNRKNGVAPLIGNYGILGGGQIQRYTNNPNFYSWTDGAPTAAVTNTATGVYVIGQDNGFQITVPADATTRTLKLYVGLWSAQGKLEATLSDGSAANLLDTSLVNPNGTSSAVYTINYRAASSGQNLTVKWTVGGIFNNWSNVTLQAATVY